MKRILIIAARECGIIRKNPIFFFCMIVLPLLVVAFFTTMLNEGQPTDLPVGIVDNDNSDVSRKLSRTLDSFQTSHIVAHYNDVSEARRAMQRGEIYAFMLIPQGTAEELIASRQPKISFYYNGVFMLAGNSTFRDLKTTATLGSASVGSAKLSALGKTEREIHEMLQPIVIDLHMINNPWANYNVYLTTTMVPGLLMLFIILITPYSIGTELKFGRSQNWVYKARGNMYIALAGKLLPQTLIYGCLMLGYEYYVFHVLGFPHPGGNLPVILLGFLLVLASQGFGMFIFGLMPSLRMSMSVCSLWAMLGFSLSGATFPVVAMDAPIQALSWLFPLRHFYMIYQLNILNGYPLGYAWPYIMGMLIFAILPLFVISKIKKAMIEYEYIP